MIPFNEDFKDLLSSFLAADVRFLIVGAYAVAFHGHARATKDLDAWVDAHEKNASLVLRALAEFGAPVTALSVRDLVDPATVF